MLTAYCLGGLSTLEHKSRVMNLLPETPPILV